MMRNRSVVLRSGVVGVALIAAVSVACSGVSQTRFLHENADLGAVGTVAVLPFQNLTDDRSAAEKVHDLFLIELLSTGAFDVVEPGQVTQVLRQSRIESVEALGPEEFQQLGRDLGVDGLFTGTVVDFGERRGGVVQAPEVAIQLGLVETLSGVTIWSTSDSKSGSTLSRQLVGVGGQSLSEATRKVIRRQLDTLFQ